MTPQIRCTIFHDVLAPLGKVVDEPLGLATAKLKLEREPTYGSLVETFEGEFVWYGSARNLLRDIEDLDGPQAQAAIQFDISYGKPFEKLFYGLFNMQELEDIDNDGAIPYKCTVPIIRNDFWAKFMNRRGIPVNLQALVDLDGEDRLVINPFNLALPSQAVQQKYSAKSGDASPALNLLQVAIVDGQAVAMDIFGELTFDEIKERLTPGAVVKLPPTDHVFKMKFGGGFKFNIRLFVWGQASTYQVSPDVNAWIQFGEAAPVALARTDNGVDFTDGVTLFELVNYNINLIAGSTVRLFLRNDNGFAVTKTAIIPNSNQGNDTYPSFQSSFDIVANTTYPNSAAESFRIHEAINAVLDRAIGRDYCLYSSYLGNTTTQLAAYDAAGCGAAYALLKGINVRGYQLAEKPHTATFDFIWSGLNPCLNLGLGLYKYPDPLFFQFLKRTTFNSFDLPDNTEWTQDASSVFEWSGDSEDHVGVTLSPAGSKSTVLKQGFVPKPAGDYKFHFNIAAAVDEEVNIKIALYFEGALVDTPYDANHVFVNSYETPDVIDFPFAAIGRFDEIRILVEAVDLNGNPSIEFHLQLFKQYQAIVNAEMIRIAPKREFYNIVPSLNISNAKLVRTYVQKDLIKSIDIGYTKGLIGSESGIDDTQTKRNYSTRFKTGGQPVKIQSTFIAAPLALEQTRRQAALEPGKDWQLDNDTFIVALNKDTLTDPELDENFTAITNLLNSDTRYNTRLSVARMAKRWLNVFSGCLQWFVDKDKFLFFAGGDGNVDMTSTLDGADCEGDGILLSEKQNIAATDDFLTKPVAYECEEHELTYEEYKTMRDNSDHAIGLSRSEVSHKVNFIQRLEWEIMASKTKFNTLLGELTPIDE